MAVFEHLPVALVEFIIGQVRISLGNTDVLVPGQLLGQLQISTRSLQYGGNKVVAEGMWGDGSLGFRSQSSCDDIRDDVASGCGGIKSGVSG